MKRKPKTRNRERTEPDEGCVATLVGSYDGAWSLGVCEGLGKAMKIAIQLDAPAVALAIAENGLASFGDKFAEELRTRRIDLAEIGGGS